MHLGLFVKFYDKIVKIFDDITNRVCDWSKRRMIAQTFANGNSYFSALSVAKILAKISRLFQARYHSSSPFFIDAS